MKKVATITINDINNYGNRLQNYAVQSILEKMEISAENIVDTTYYDTVTHNLIKDIKLLILITLNKINYIKYRNFKRFNKSIKYSKIITNDTKMLTNYKSKYDYFIVGSDQVWNPNFAISNVMLLKSIPNNKRISFSASIGVNNLPESLKEKYKTSLSKFKSISVREDRGKEIIEELTGRKDVEVLIDPTMLLTCEEWDKVSKEPKQMKKLNGKKYILNYFLGNLSDERKSEIERIAKENDCEIINILDKNDPFYVSGPSEFLYLEKNAFLICTDSFHSSVFAILYNRPFIIFDREQAGIENMNSRLETLINKFKLKNRRYNGKNITKENLEHDYSETYKILEKEREKSRKFLEKALEIEGSD